MSIFIKRILLNINDRQTYKTGLGKLSSDRAERGQIEMIAMMMGAKDKI
jgi:hypothetical protein